MPIRWDPVQAAPRADYPEQLASMQARVSRGEAVLILFNTLSSQQAFLPTEAGLVDGLATILLAPDGSVHGAPH